jgi:UDP-N-acetylglucosamine enolpyruvyl transferase
MAHTSPTRKIDGAHQLSGLNTTKGSMATESVILTNIPRTNDVFDMVSLLRSAGTSVTWLDRNTTLEIRLPAADSLDIEASRKTKAIALLVAALAKDQDDFILPGGCSFEDHPSLEQRGRQDSAVCECLDRKSASPISCSC